MKKLILALTLSLSAPALSAATVTALGDMSGFTKIIADVQTIAAKGDFKAAEKRITDFEKAWDKAHTKMRPLSPHLWSNVDVASDQALEALRAAKPDPAKVKTTLATLMVELDNPTAEMPQN